VFPTSRRWTLLGSAIIAIVIVMQALPFVEGYRRSADEVAFLDYAMQGWRAVATTTEWLAFSQGRLGLLFTTPLNALGALYSDILAVRTAFVVLHFAVFALFAAYFSLVSARHVTGALLLLLVTLQPLCRVNEFMPPVTYPLQNSLPFLWLLLARYVVVVESRRADGGRPSRLWPACAVFILAMMTTEYAFLLGSALLLAEYGFALGSQARPGISWRDRLARLMRQRKTALDALSVGIALGTYVGFRAIYPSGYEGNVLDAAFDIQRVLATTFHRVWAGTIFSHGLAPPLSAPWYLWLAAAVVGIATTFALVLTLPTIRSLPSPLLVITGCLAVILYVSFPLAANARQQRWCLEEGACGYLDSRLSYLAVAVIALSVLAWVLRSLTWPILAKVFVVSVAVVLGILGAMTFLDSWQRGRTMHADAGAWRNANLLACYPDHQPASDALLVKMIDSDNRVPFHPGSDRAGYWRRYLRHEAGSVDCKSAASRLAEVHRLGPAITLGQTVDFAAGTGGSAYLGTGWSLPEPPFGVWSDGPQAELMLVPRDVPADRQAYLKVRFHPYFGPSVVNQTIEVIVNGVPTEEWKLTLERDRAGCCERFIALPRTVAKDGLVTVVFRLSQPRTPSLEPSSPETRRLGLALVTATLTDSRVQ
jgi:hypothetical protein